MSWGLRGEFNTGLEKLTEKSLNIWMRKSQIHQSPMELVGSGSRSTDLEFVTHSNRKRCQFFSVLTFLVLFVLRQKVGWKPFEIRSTQHRINKILHSKSISIFGGTNALLLHPGVETPGNKQFSPPKFVHHNSVHRSFVNRESKYEVRFTKYEEHNEI